MHATINSFSREISTFFDNYFKEEGLATSYIELLILLLESDALTQQEIAEKMNLAPSTITRFVRKLIKNGFVEKKKETGKTVVLLTAEGKKSTQKFKKIYDQAVKDLEMVLGQKFVETTSQLLEHGAHLMQHDV